MSSKGIKYSEIDLTKSVEDLYPGNYKTPLRGMKDLNQCKDIPCSSIVILTVVKMAISSL